MRILILAYAMLAATGQYLALAFSAEERPNLLLILADDMGYGDLSCMGSKTVVTPNLDRLAKDGVLLTQAYVTSAVCSPSRAGLVTGRDPRRFGYEANLNQSAENYSARPELLGLPVQEHTLGDHFRAMGYRTALIGKWHLGREPAFHPNRRGFDYFCGMLEGGHNYFPARRRSRIQRNGELVSEFSSPYLTDFFTDEAVRQITKTSPDPTDVPWMLFVSYNAPHTPMQATKEDLSACNTVSGEGRRTYAAMMRALDRGVGRILDALTETSQTENTLVVFLSDNGGATNNSSWNGPLSGAKGTLREGGVRVPMIWSWPSKLQPGRIDDAVASSLDILPTFLAAAGGEALPLQEAPPYHDRPRPRRRRRGVRLADYDGLDLLPLLTARRPLPTRDLYWRLQGQAAIRSADLKLIRLAHRPAQLYQVPMDSGERSDLAATNTADVDRLFAKMAAWETMRPTVPIWSSEPFWDGDSARIYDTWAPREEPQ
ncbi:MAG: sulfatase-like hydrolase/transferase [Planctomycetota bacterium]